MKKIIISLVFVLAKFVLLAQTNIGFSESEITLITQSGNLHGTITIPKNIKTSPIVLITLDQVLLQAEYTLLFQHIILDYYLGVLKTE